MEVLKFDRVNPAKTDRAVRAKLRHPLQTGSKQLHGFLGLGKVRTNTANFSLESGPLAVSKRRIDHHQHSLFHGMRFPVHLDPAQGLLFRLCAGMDKVVEEKRAALIREIVAHRTRTEPSVDVRRKVRVIQGVLKFLQRLP